MCMSHACMACMHAAALRLCGLGARTWHCRRHGQPRRQEGRMHVIDEVDYCTGQPGRLVTQRQCDRELHALRRVVRHLQQPLRRVHRCALGALGMQSPPLKPHGQRLQRWRRRRSGCALGARTAVVRASQHVRCREHHGGRLRQVPRRIGSSLATIGWSLRWICRATAACAGACGAQSTVRAVTMKSSLHQSTQLWGDPEHLHWVHAFAGVHTEASRSGQFVDAHDSVAAKETCMQHLRGKSGSL